MKNAIAILFLAVFAQKSVAQVDYFREETEWHIQHIFVSFSCGPSYSNTIYYISGDTVINDKNYRVIKTMGERVAYPFGNCDCIDMVYALEGRTYFVRQEGYQVYEYYYDTDTLIYDFDLNIGEVVTQGIYQEELIGDTVQLIDTLDVDGALLRRFHFKNRDPNTHIMLIEGIGLVFKDSHDPGFFQGGLFVSNTMDLADSGDNFSCYAYDGSPYFPHSTGECEFYIPDRQIRTNIEDVEQVTLNLSPNPVGSRLTVSTSRPHIDAWEIYNIKGEKVAGNRRLQHTPLSIELDNSLKEGVYMLYLTSGNDLRTMRFIKRQ